MDGRGLYKSDKSISFLMIYALDTIIFDGSKGLLSAIAF